MHQFLSAAAVCCCCWHQQAKLDSEEQQLASLQSRLQLLQGQQAELSSSLKPLLRHLAAARKATAAAQAESDANKVRMGSFRFSAPPVLFPAVACCVAVV
jgi:septal ring factor EnvC (AmiA/AmiB activator)